MRGMKTIIKSMGEGKTTEAIKLAAETNSYLVVRTRQRAQEVFRTAYDSGIEIHMPITYREFIGKHYGEIKGFIIDDADDMLQWMAGQVPLVAITFTPDEDIQ